MAALTSWSAKQRRAEAALSPCMNRVEKGPLEISAMTSGAGRRLRRDACFQALAGERQRRRGKQVHPLLDPAPVPGSHAPSCDGIDQVRSSRGPVPTRWLHAASTCWALPQRRNRAWPRLTRASGLALSQPSGSRRPRATAGAGSCVARRAGTMRRRGKVVRKSLRRRGQRPTSSFANQSRTGDDQQNPKR